jgi:hypothetical protein
MASKSKSSDADPEKEVPLKKGELDKAANRGADTKPRPLTKGEHPSADFRSRVENTPAGDLNMDPREPYPTGNPPDPEEVRKMTHGH